MEIDEKNIMALGISALLLLSLASLLITKSMVLFFNMMIIGTIIIVVPFSIYQFMEYKKLKNCEDEFPNFLRDLAESRRSGLSILQGIQTCSRSDYGALTPEIIKMKNQFSWNIPMKSVFDNFRKRFAKSNIINHSVLIIMQMEESGGKTEDIMDSLADNIENLKETESEKKVIMNQHIMSMYVIFFIFLGISISLIKFLMPVISVSDTNAVEGVDLLIGTGVNPCQSCLPGTVGEYGIECLSCGMFFSVCDTFGFGNIDTIGCYYKALFFFMIIIQGIFSGLVAGQIASENIIVGIKHSLIMAVSGFTLFMVAATLGLI